MEFSELLLKRRSIRKYLDRQVDVETLKDLIKESTFAPSAGNEQPWKYVIVNNKEILKRISDECKENILKRVAADPDDYAKKYAGMLQNPSFNIFYNAPSLVIIIGKKNKRNLKEDISLAAAYLMMTAADKGLGTCWINFAREMNPETLLEIGIPEDHDIVAPVITGYPAVEPEVPARKEIEILKITS